MYAIYRSLAPPCIHSTTQPLFTQWPDVLFLAQNHLVHPALFLTGGPESADSIRTFRETF